MALKLIKQGLTELTESCPNCGTTLYIFIGKGGRVHHVAGGSLSSRNGKRFGCDRCYSILEVME